MLQEVFLRKNPVLGLYQRMFEGICVTITSYWSVNSLELVRKLYHFCFAPKDASHADFQTNMTLFFRSVRVLAILEEFRMNIDSI